MKNFMRWVGLGATAALAACATPDDVTNVQNVLAAQAPSGTPFQQALFQEYQAYTKQQTQTAVEWVDATYIAGKAQRVANGETVLPDELAQYALPPAAVPELTAARQRLMGYLANGAATRVPAATAKAQVAFDCWLEQAGHNSLKSCRTTFLTHEPMLKKAAAVTEVAVEARRNFVVTFDLGSANLSSKSAQTLKEVAATQAQMHAPILTVTGFTDTVGSAETNMRLARHRTDVVAAELVNLGVHPGVIALDSRGENQTAVATGDNVAEAANRRVEVTLGGTTLAHGGYGGYAYGDRNSGWGRYGWGGYYGANGFAVFFNSGSSTLSPEAIERLKQVVAAQKSLNPKSIRVIGFTDRTGSATTNARLSLERAKAVAAEITKLGGTAAAVEAQPGASWGMNQDGRARRVEILFDY